MKAELRIYRNDDGRANGTLVVVLAQYSDVRTRRVRLGAVDVALFRGYLHKIRARQYAHEIESGGP